MRTISLAWWCIRASGASDRDRGNWVDFKAVARHRRMLLTVAYSGTSALLALAAGIAGNDHSWQQFTGAQPQIVKATASLVTEVHEHKGDWTARIHAVAELDGVVLPIVGETVQFRDDPNASAPEELELWAVFDPDTPEAGLVVTGDFDDAQSVLDYPFAPMLAFVLVILAMAWGIQLFTLKRSLYGKWPAEPIGSLPWQIWVTIAVCCALYGAPLVWLAWHASFEGPYNTAHRATLENAASICAGMIITAAGMLGMVFYHVGMNSWAAYQRRTAQSPHHRRAGNGNQDPSLGS